jgi:tRNA threonylcarbamoyladenosine biosynthesis protein TsaB
MLLAFDTSTRITSVALGDAAGVRAERTLGSQRSASEVLLPAIDAACAEAGVGPAEITGVVVGGGPGSFTGLRIAAATAKALCHSRGVPLWSYSGLAAVAMATAVGARPLCALFDARGGEVFCACYRFAGGWEELLAPTVMHLDALLERTAGWDPLFAGEGAEVYRPQIERSRPGSLAPDHEAPPRASALLRLHALDPERGAVSDVALWEPEYLRSSGAERIAAEGRRG